MWILISLPLTLIVYLLFPIIFKVSTGGVDSKKATLYAFLNSLAGYVIFTIIYIATGANAIASAPVAFTYFWIGKAILTKKFEMREVVEDDKDNQEEILCFWRTFNKYLATYDYPFRFRVLRKNGEIERFAELYDEEGCGVKLECGIARGILRISACKKVEQKGNDFLVEEKKQLEKILKISLDVVDVGDDQVEIRKDWKFAGHTKDDYPKVIKKSLLDMIVFFEYFKEQNE